MSSGHQDSILGMAGANCASTAQSYGASIQEIEMAAKQTSRSGCSLLRRTVR
jgi:hypothetical protein